MFRAYFCFCLHLKCCFLSLFPRADNWFGVSVSLSSAGNVFAAGARLNGADNAGSVRVFQYMTNTSSWEQLGQDLDGEAEDDRFGFSVAISGNGTVVASGGPINSENGLASSGHARVYTLD